jgi:hypothetical protein
MSWAAPDLVHLMSSPATMEPAFRQIRGQCFANSCQDNSARLAKKFCLWKNLALSKNKNFSLVFMKLGPIVLNHFRLKICEKSTFSINS